MKSNALAMLVAAIVLQAISLAQKAPPPPPPSGNRGGTMSTPMTQPMPDINRDIVQRQLDEERMNTPEPVTKPVTMAELEKTLADNHLAGDGKLAGILSNLTLTERVNGARLGRWNSQFSGSQTRQALMVLADESAFLPLPTEDIPAMATPSPAEQRQMIAAFAKFLSADLSRLPNFRASRVTTYFEDRLPRQLALSTDPAETDPRRNRPLHVVGTSTIKVAYVAGEEVREKDSGFADPDLYASRFTTAGEFGPIIQGMLMDARQSKLLWARWESGIGGPLAVFRFDASKGKSHYAVKAPGGPKLQNQFVAYRGEIAINPSDGTIVWLSVVAQPAQGDEMAAADIAVDYGRVEIGQQEYTCPVHGVALSKVPIIADKGKKQDQPVALRTELNDVLFREFHVFRGETRIAQENTEQP